MHEGVTFIRMKLSIQNSSHAFITFFALLLLVAVRWYGYVNIGFVNFDSAFNFLIAREISKGDFSQLFNHAAPLLHLIDGGFYWLTGDYQWLKLFHICMNVFSIWYFSKTLEKHFQWNFSDSVLYLVLFGTSFFAVYSSHYVSLEPLSWLFFSLLFRQILDVSKRNRWYWIALWSSLLLLVNYKFLPVLVPVFLICEWIFHRNMLMELRWKVILTSVSIFLFLILLVVLLGIGIGKPFWIYPGSIYVHAVARTIHPFLIVPHWNFDWSYYPRFFFEMEQPLLIPFLLLFYFGRKYWTNLPVKYCMVFLLISLMGMLIVQKAPRGLLFCYPILYGLILIPVFSVKHRWIHHVLIFGMLIWNGYTLKINCWDYCHTNYGKMANVVSENGVKELSVTSSCLIVPYLPENISLKIIKGNDSDSSNWKNICLFDSYAVAAGVGHVLENKSNYTDTLAYFKEATLDAPMVWLESSEYNGWSYQQTMDFRAENLPGYLLLMKK